MTQVACSLTTIDAARQVLRWNDLGRQASSMVELEGGFAVTFPVDMADYVEALAAREAACCGFLTIATTRTDDAVRLEITADDDAQPVIEALALAIAP